jgi:hypothetical protein
VIVGKTQEIGLARALIDSEVTNVPERGVEPLCPFGQTGLSRPRIPFRHPGLGPHNQPAGNAHQRPNHSATAVVASTDPLNPPPNLHLTRVSP